MHELIFLTVDISRYTPLFEPSRLLLLREKYYYYYSYYYLRHCLYQLNVHQYESDRE